MLYQFADRYYETVSACYIQVFVGNTLVIE